MRRVAHIMGLPISIDIPDARTDSVFDAAFTRLRAIDADYSPYKPGSYVSRVQAGSMKTNQLPAEQQQVLQACQVWNQQTNGYFDAYFSGAYDPSGYVKSWAIQQAANTIEAAGHHTYCINAGGDVLLRSDNGHIWRIALQHPTQKDGLMGSIQASNQAIATSGTYVRGNHIVNPLTHQPAASVLSATVIGPDIITADVYATAVCAMGYERAQSYAKSIPDYRFIVVTPKLDAFDSGQVITMS